jgi:hypothetical protein
MSVAPRYPVARQSPSQKTVAPVTPLWLQLLMRLSQASSVFTFCVVAAALGIYSWTVYTQQLWSQEYRRLENLQRHERQLTANHETLKNYLAQEAENPEVGFVAPTPSNMIFLSPAPTVALGKAPSLPQNNLPMSTNTPLGY